MSSKKLRLSIVSNQTLFIAGSIIAGQIIVRNPADGLWFEDVVIIFSGREEIVRDGHTYSRQLCDERVIVLGPHRAPASFISSGTGLMKLRKGKFFLPFAIRTRESLPPSLAGSKLRIVYSLDCIFSENPQKKTTHTRQIMLVEYLTPKERQQASLPIVAIGDRSRLFFGGEGQIEVRCRLNKSIYKAGDMAYLALGIDNQTKRRVTKVKVSLVRRITTAIPARPRTYSEKAILEQTLVGDDFVFGKMETREVLIEIPIPPGLSRIRKGRSMEIFYFMKVEATVPFSKNPTIDLPFEVCHPASLDFPPQTSLFSAFVPEMREEDEEDDNSGALQDHMIAQGMPTVDEDEPWPSQAVSSQDTDAPYQGIDLPSYALYYPEGTEPTEVTTGERSDWQE